MHPILFHVGDTGIHSYGVVTAIAFLVLCFVVLRRASLEGLSKDHIADVIFWTAVAGLIGSRALYVFENPEQFDGPGDWVNLRTGGLVFYGAMLTGLPVGSLLLRRHKLPFYRVMDLFAIGLPLGHAISRVGCLLAGCCFGTPTDLPWGITYDHELAPAPHGVATHPTQLYEVAYLLLIFAVVRRFHPKRAFDGQVMLLYLVLYAAFRTVNEFFRGDPTRGWFLEGLLGQTVSVSQGLSVLLAVFALVVFFVGARRASRPAVE